MFVFLSYTLFTPYALCIETKRNCVNHNKGKVTLKIFPWDSMGLAMSWRSGSLKKSKNTPWDLKSINSVMVKAIPWEVIMSSTKYEGSSYPTHFLKSRGSTITNRSNFLKGRAKKSVQFLCDEMIIMHCLLENKAKHILNRHFLSSCSDTIYCKSIKRNWNKKCRRNVMDTPKRIGLA